MLTPYVNCFVKDDREKVDISWVMDGGEPFSGSYDFDPSHFIFIEETEIHEHDWEYTETFTCRIIRSNEENRHWMLKISNESWSDFERGFFGEHGNIVEVTGKLVSKMEWKEIINVT